jgi:hypothetical protein
MLLPSIGLIERIKFMQLHLIAVLAFIMAISGCATSNIKTPPLYNVSLIAAPEVNHPEVGELGETLASALCSRQAESWRISEFGSGEDSEGFSLRSGITAWRFPTQVLKPKGTTSKGVSVFVATQGSTGVPPYRVPVDTNGGLYNSFCEKEGVLHFMCDSLVSTPFVEVAANFGMDAWAERATYMDLSYPSLQQEMIYNGRVGVTIQHIYLI